MLLAQSGRRIWMTIVVKLMETVAFAGIGLSAEPSEVFRIWPDDKMPGRSQTDPNQPERIVTDRRRPFYQITNVAIPTVSVFLAPQKIRTGGAVLVCPGGGLQRVAYEHEGLEIADWLNPLGISVFVLKYRVPAPSSTSMLDAQRALGLLRQRANEFRIDPERMGVLGFSAGGEVAVVLAVQQAGRAYEPIDQADTYSARPNNACIIYPGGIVRDGTLRREIAESLDAKLTPPMFIAHAFGDASENSLALATELKRAKVPCEMHLYQEGGHGFGARDSGLPLNGWKASYVDWLRAQGFLDRPEWIDYADRLVKHDHMPADVAPLSAARPALTISDGYTVQRRFVRRRLEQNQIAGFRGTVLDVAGKVRADTGVLFRTDRIDVSENVTLERPNTRSSLGQLSVGYVVSTGADISTRIQQDKHIKGAFEAVVPVLEIRGRETGNWTDADRIAINFGSPKFVVGTTRVGPDEVDQKDVQLELQRNGQRFVDGKLIGSHRWRELITVVNQLVDSGYSLRPGDIVVCSVRGLEFEAIPGAYRANCGELGELEFVLK